MSPSETVVSKSHRYLREGRLTVVEVDDDRIVARCRGDGVEYRLGWNAGERWWCDCPARRDRCCHLVALRLVTTRQAGAA